MAAAHHHAQAQVHHGHHGHGQVQAFPPHHANHASIAPLMQRDGHHQPQQQQYYAQDQQAHQQAQGEEQQGQGNASQMPEIRSLLNTPAGGSPASVADGVEEQHGMEGAEVGGSPRERREVYHAQA